MAEVLPAYVLIVEPFCYSAVVKYNAKHDFAFEQAAAVRALCNV